LVEREEKLGDDEKKALATHTINGNLIKEVHSHKKFQKSQKAQKTQKDYSSYK
jgi:hypothetical protein